MITPELIPRIKERSHKKRSVGLTPEEQTEQPALRRAYLNTIRELLGRWAPRNENDTALYVRLVSDEMGVPACCGIDLSDKGTLCALVDAMVYVENGVHIPKADIEAGYELM